jgi:hypothetical protein
VDQMLLVDEVGSPMKGDVEERKGRKWKGER